MNPAYHLPLRLWRWLLRFRHRCGYGIHSPLAFDFVTGVIYCDEAYYAYEPLRAPLQASLSRLDEYEPASGLTAKDLRLIFRLANYAEATAIALYGATPAIERYISAARPTASVTHIAPQAAPVPSGVDPVGLIYCHTPSSAASAVDSFIAGPTSPTAMIVIHAPHRSAAASAAWQRLVDSPTATLTFDLWRFCIALKSPKITPQHYVINYF